MCSEEFLFSVYKKCSVKATGFFIKHEIIDKEKKAVYEYGFEILLSTLAYACVFILISLITKTFLASLVFLAGFFIVRTIAGGYHAGTYLKCHLLSMVNQEVFVILYHCIAEQLRSYACVIMLLLSAILLIAFAPVDHPNKPFIKTEKKRFRVLCCVYGLVLFVIALLCFFVFKSIPANYLISYSIGTLSASISVVVAKINLKKGKKAL